MTDPAPDGNSLTRVLGQVFNAYDGHERMGVVSRPAGRGAWSLPLILMLVNAGCGGYRPVPEFDPGHLPETQALEGTPVTRLWRSRPIRSPSYPVGVDGTNAYLGGSDRRIVAVDLESGKNRWAVRVPGPLVGGVQVKDSLVFAATDRPGGKVYALHSISGSQAWATGTGYVQAPLLLMNDRVIVLTRSGRMLALDAGTGKVRWRVPLLGTKVGPVALDAEHFAVTSYDSVYRVRLTDGKVVARKRSPGTVVSPWKPLGSLIIASTADSQVVALRADSLTLAWTTRLDAPLINAPAIAGDTIFAVTRTGSIYRIEAGGALTTAHVGTSTWPATGAPARIGPWLLAGASDGSLRAFDPGDGHEAWKTPMGRPLELAPVPLPDGSFLALGGRGDLHRIKP